MMDINSLSQVISSRRSIFPPMYNNKPLSKETILTILENANCAPNHKKTEPWRFKIFTGSAISSLSEYLGGYYKQYTPAETFSEIKYKKTLSKPLKSACVIAICMYDDPVVTIPEWEQIAAVACAVQNMWLSCTALGIGAYWSSPKSIIEADDFLSLGPDERCLGLFYMGYSDVTDLPSKRGDINDKIVWK